MQSSITINDASTHDHNVFIQEIVSLSQQLEFAFTNGAKKACIFLEPKVGALPRGKPQMLKAELSKYIGANSSLQIRFTRAGKLLVETTDVQCAKAVTEINSLLGVPIQASVQQEYITTRFAIHNIDISVRLEELGQELQNENPIKIKEMRRFTRKDSAGIHLTETVLITVFGTNLPREIKMFYMIEKIRPFYDRPRQCLNCWKFDHATGKCKNETRCKKCGGTHSISICTSDIQCCANCSSPHLASDLECSARKKEMDFLKFKSDQHLPITEARRRYAKQPTTKSYAETMQSAPNQPSSQYVTQVDLEQTLNNFFQRTQDMILQIVQQQALLFSKAIEGLVTSLQSSSASTPQVKSCSTEESSSRIKQRIKKLKLASTLSSVKDSFSQAVCHLPTLDATPNSDAWVSEDDMERDG